MCLAFFRKNGGKDTLHPHHRPLPPAPPPRLNRCTIIPQASLWVKLLSFWIVALWNRKHPKVQKKRKKTKKTPKIILTPQTAKMHHCMPCNSFRNAPDWQSSPWWLSTGIHCSQLTEVQSEVLPIGGGVLVKTHKNAKFDRAIEEYWCWFSNLSQICEKNLKKILPIFDFRLQKLFPGCRPFSIGGIRKLFPIRFF